MKERHFAMCKIYKTREEIPEKAIVPQFILQSRAAAEEFLSLTAFPVAVGFRDEVEDTEEVLAIIERIKTAEERLDAFIEKQSVRNFQAKNIGCRKCGSSIAREYLKNDICPVCGSDLRVQSVIDGEAQQRAKIEESKKLLEQQREINRLKLGEVLWMSNACECEDCETHEVPEEEFDVTEFAVPPEE